MDCSRKHNGDIRNTEASCPVAEIDKEQPEDLSAAWNMVQKTNKSFVPELSSGISPLHLSKIPKNASLQVDHVDNAVSTSKETSCAVAEIDKEESKNLSTGWNRLSGSKSDVTELHSGLSPPHVSKIPENSSLQVDHVDNAVNHVDHQQIISEGWKALKNSMVTFRGQPVGTIAAFDDSDEKLNYDQVFVRDFVPSALAFLMDRERREFDIVKNFITKTLHLQSLEKKIDWFHLSEGVMPASFKVFHDPQKKQETLIADFGGSAIGRVAPVDSGFWWIILLRAYTKATGDSSLADRSDCQKGMRLILNLCLSEGFDTFPTLLCADGCCMIDRRMGLYGYPIEIQALFFMALRCALELLKEDAEGKEFKEQITKRLHALSYHVQSYFWLDLKQLNDVYRYKTEEYSHTAVNKFNVIPDSLPDWIFDFMPHRGGYFVGNVSPARMDFRWFCLGNCMAILSCLATPEQSIAIMDLIEAQWQDLIGEMPAKICYPALENHEWRIITGCDPKNTRWSYHNGGSWPVLIWLLTAASIKTGRPHIARRALEIAETRLQKDNWPEYYDGKLGRYIGKQARKAQTWSIAGYLVARMMLDDPSNVGLVALEEDKHLKPLSRRLNSL